MDFPPTMVQPWGRQLRAGDYTCGAADMGQGCPPWIPSCAIPFCSTSQTLTLQETSPTPHPPLLAPLCSSYGGNSAFSCLLSLPQGSRVQFCPLLQGAVSWPWPRAQFTFTLHPCYVCLAFTLLRPVCNSRAAPLSLLVSKSHLLELYPHFSRFSHLQNASKEI